MHQAIEGFALMVKKTAQMLQSFGTELAETELPNEIQATTILLSTHTDKKNKMKVNEVHWSLLFIRCVIFCVCLCLCMCIPLILLCVCTGGPAGGSGSGRQAAGEHQ